MQQSYRKLARIARALAHPTRLHILDILARQEACVCHLTAVVGQRQANVSQHLMVLREAGLVRDRREGVMIYYRLSDARLPTLINLLKELLRAWDPDIRFPEIPETPVEGCPCPACSAKRERYRIA